MSMTPGLGGHSPALRVRFKIEKPVCAARKERRESYSIAIPSLRQARSESRRLPQ
jgi:hypothetical protein